MPLASLHGAKRHPASPSADHPAPRRGLILVTLSGCTAMVTIDTSAVNVALDNMQSQLGMSVSELAWVINAYTLAWACTMPVGGRIGDLRGRRAGFVGGAAVFVAASVASGLAPDGGLVIAARIVQGVGAAFMFPAMLALAAANFPDRERPRAIAMLVTVAGIGQASGPLIGGVLVDTLGWRALFFINLPIGAAAIFAALRLIPESRADTDDRTIDWLGGALVTVGLVCLVLAIDFGPDWGTAPTVGVAAIGLLVLAGFLVAEYRVDKPLLGPELLTNRNFLAMNASGALLFAVFIPTLMYSALLVQNVFDYSAVQAGATLIPFVLPIALVARPAAEIAERWDAAKVMSVGYALTALGLGWLAAVVSADMSIASVLLPLFVAGVGFGTCVALIASTVVGSVAPDDAGTASGSNFAIRLLGGAVGLAVVTNLFDGRGGGTEVAPATFVDALRPALVLLAIAGAAGLVINAALVRDDRAFAH